MEPPVWATHVVNFGPGEIDPAHSPYRTYGAFMEHVGEHAGGLRIMDLGDGRVALDEAAIDDLRRSPVDADGCIDDQLQIWIGGLSWPVDALAAVEAADPPHVPTSADYVVGGPLLSFGQLRDRMAAEHQQCALEGLCCDDPTATPWHACHMFALARIRGVCHTTHITITADAPSRFLIVDVTTDGPSAACGGRITEASSYLDAIRAITADLLDEWPND